MTKKIDSIKNQVTPTNWGNDSLSLQTTAQIGICTLLLFEKIFPERFELLGVTDFLQNNRLKISTN